MPAIIRSLLLSGEALNGEINARKSAAPKMEIPMVTIGRNQQNWNMFAKAFLLFRDLRFDLRFGVWRFKILVWYSIQDLRFGLKIWISSEEDYFEILEWDLICDLPITDMMPALYK